VVGASEHAEEGGDVGEVDEHGNLEEDIGGEELKKEHCGCVDLMGWADGGLCVRWMEVLGTIGDERRVCDELQNSGLAPNLRAAPLLSTNERVQ
jgi:hypothetical protein